ncbi:MAG: STAS domain-containing protein [bacterium]|nr:STAS domain-containing protein [bacterium]
MIDLKIEEKNNIIIIEFIGLLLMEEICLVMEPCEDELKKQPETIALNLEGLEQIDSVGINYFFKLSNVTTEKNIKLVIFGPNEYIQKVFSMIKLGNVIDILSKKEFEDKYFSG